MNKIYCFLILTLFLNLAKAQETNLALGKKVTSSSIDNATLPNSNLVDGNFSTVARTGSAQAPPNAEWFMVDLGQDYFIENIILGAVVPDNTKSRRFMIVTWPSNLAGLGYSPQSYVTTQPSVSSYNRFIYSSVTSGEQIFGRTSSNPNVPGNTGQTLGPVFNNGIYNLDIGIHKARYILLLNLQDTNLEFTELQVTSGSVPVRSFVNGGFESGTTTSTWAPVPEGNLSGWSTTEPVAGLSPNTAKLIEAKGGSVDMISVGFIGVPPFEGLYYAELNSFLDSKLEQQPICILASETFNWSFAHRGRRGVDVMRLVIDDVDVGEFTDNNSQSGIHTGIILPDGTTSNLSINKDATTASGWTRYFGSWKNNSGVSKQITFGFRAVSSAGGISDGNFLDDVRVSGLSAIMTFDQLNPKGDESMGTSNLPKILINGPVTTSRTVQINIIGGTAIRGVDYTTTPATGNISVTIPAGNYDGTAATAISLSSVIQINQDFISEGDETIILQLLDPGTGDLQIADASTCQGAVITSTYSITDFVCYKNPVTNGPTLSTNVGISSFNRAGNNDIDWPKVRKGGYIALESATKGLVVTRTKKANILNPVIGMIIYETDDKCLSIYTSTGWKCYQSASCPD